MNIHDLEAFVAVVETGSIVGAATRLSLTQPGITRRIQSLEERLGAALLDRLSKPLKPTAAGREAYEHGRRVLRCIDDLKAGVRPEGEASGEFRVGIQPYLSDAALLSPLDRLRAEFPRLTLRITTGWSPTLMEQVAHSELDAAALCLAEGTPIRDELVAEDLGAQPVVLVAATGLRIPKAPKLADLAEFPWVLNETGCGFRTYLRRVFESRRLPFQVGVEASSADMRLSLVARGHGIGVVTAAALVKSPWRKLVRVIKSADFEPQVRAWLVHRPPAGRLATALEVFRAALLEAL